MLSNSSSNIASSLLVTNSLTAGLTFLTITSYTIVREFWFEDSLVRLTSRRWQPLLLCSTTVHSQHLTTLARLISVCCRVPHSSPSLPPGLGRSVKLGQVSSSVEPRPGASILSTSFSCRHHWSSKSTLRDRLYVCTGLVLDWETNVRQRCPGSVLEALA